MSNEKEFKDALKNKLNEKEFQFDEANWLKASGMLDATREEKKKRPFPYFLVAGILLFIGLSSFIIYKFSGNTPVKEVALANTNASAHTTPEVKENIVNETNNSKIQLPTTKLSKEKINSEIKITVEKTEPVQLTEKKETQSTAKTISQKSLKNKKEKLNTIASVNNKNKKQKNAIVKNAPVLNSKQEKEDNAIAKQNTKPEEKKETPVTTTIPAVVANETVAAVNTSVNETKPEENVTSVATPNASTVDSAKATVVVAEPVKRDSTLKLKEPVHFVSFEAGASYLFGWNNPGKRDADGVNPIVGLNYSNTLNTPFVFSIGLHYTMVRNLSYSNHVVTTTRYNFGEETDVMVFTPTTMHYLVAPIKLGYTYKEKNVFGIGYNAAYLVNLNSNVELYGQSSGQKGNTTVLKTSGYTQGFKLLESQASLFYRRRLGKDLWVNTEFIYGLTDIKDNAFFNSNVFERNTGIKITLIYNLFKK